MFITTFDCKMLNSHVVTNSVKKNKLYNILQIYLVPFKKGQQNSSQLEPEHYDTKTYRARVKMMVRDSLFKDVKLWDDTVMWNVCPYEKDTMLVDAMKYFKYQSKDEIFKARWWYTHRSLIKRQINTKRNYIIDAMKRNFAKGKYQSMPKLLLYQDYFE